MKKLLALVALLFLSPAIGWGQVGSDIALQGQSGNWVQFIPNAQITVCTSSALPVGNTCAPLATVYTDQTLGTPLAQPVLADATGNYTVFATGGIYFVCVVNPNVTPNTHYCKLIQIGLSGSFAPINSPTFTGIPAGPTAAPGNNTTQLATTAFVAAALGGAGSLTIASASAPASLNLSTEGTYDWLASTALGCAGGQMIAPTGFIWKMLGNSMVAAKSVVVLQDHGLDTSLGCTTTGGSLSFSANTGDVGSPGGQTTPNPPSTLAASTTINSSTAPGGGYQFTVPANNVSRTMRLYMAAGGSTNPNSTTITAHLMDGSASDAVVTLTNSAFGGGNGTPFMITITFKSGVPSSLLVTVLNTTNGGLGVVGFYGYTIQ